MILEVNEPVFPNKIGIYLHNKKKFSLPEFHCHFLGWAGFVQGGSGGVIKDFCHTLEKSAPERQKMENSVARGLPERRGMKPLPIYGWYRYAQHSCDNTNGRHKNTPCRFCRGCFYGSYRAKRM